MMKGSSRHDGGRGRSDNSKQRCGKDERKRNGDERSKKSTKHRKSQNNRQRRCKPSWRKQIPQGTVDPITLEDLRSLPYPPFALSAAAPYLPVPEWPATHQQKGGDEKQTDKGISVGSSVVVTRTKDPQVEVRDRERERRLLKDQWGDKVASITTQTDEEEPNVTENLATPSRGNAVNLFDGKALAYYMTSQLQFIDPLNRRDLDREEIVALDRYLKRHGASDSTGSKVSVLEAYDNKGVSLSMAGAASTTAAGRAQMLQEEAQVLLDALFDHRSARGSRSRQHSGNDQNHDGESERDHSNALAQQYNQFLESRQEAARRRPVSQVHSGSEASEVSDSNNEDEAGWRSEDNGVYGNHENGGIMIIDDDLNPGMRGENNDRPAEPAAGAIQPAEQFPALSSSPNGNEESHNSTMKSSFHLWGEASRIVAGNRSSNLQTQNFPALPKKSTTASSQHRKKKEDAIKEREQTLLKEQWGSAFVGANRT